MTRQETSVAAWNSSSELHVQDAELADETDRSAMDLNQAFQIRMLSRQGKFLKKIDDALKRITDGSYGICEDCDEDIELARLQARPTTTLCLNCKEAQETHEKQFIAPRRHTVKLVGW